MDTKTGGTPRPIKPAGDGMDKLKAADPRSGTDSLPGAKGGGHIRASEGSGGH